MVNTQFNFEKENPKFPKIFILKKKTQLIQTKPFKPSCQNIFCFFFFFDKLVAKTLKTIIKSNLHYLRERDHQVSPKFKANPIDI